MPNRRSTRFYRRILGRVPRILVTDPWQCMWAVALMGLGVATFINMFSPHATSVVDSTLYYTALRVSWSLTFLAGGLFQLIALHRYDAPLERLGISLAGMGCTVYAIALFSNGSAVGNALGIVFAFMAIGHGSVLMASAVARRTLGGS